MLRGEVLAAFHTTINVSLIIMYFIVVVGSK